MTGWAEAIQWGALRTATAAPLSSLKAELINGERTPRTTHDLAPAGAFGLRSASGQTHGPHHVRRDQAHDRDARAPGPSAGADVALARAAGDETGHAGRNRSRPRPPRRARARARQA